MPELDIILVLAVAAGATVLFITEKLRIDVAALTVLIALIALRLIVPGQALYGFSNPATATVACMFVLSAGLARTGLVDWLARHLDRLAGGGETRLLLVLTLAIASVSAFVVNTATVAVFIPVAIVLARRRKVAESRILMPLSFASQTIMTTRALESPLGSSTSSKTSHSSSSLPLPWSGFCTRRKSR